MAPVLIACAGFLVAVLWMDLIFDSQAPWGAEPVDEPTLAAIAAYYHRATTTSQPRGSLIASVMVVLLIALGLEAWRGEHPGWLLAVSAALAGGSIALALSRTVPNAVRLGRREAGTAEQSRLARRVHFDHIVCLMGMVAFLALWLFQAQR